MSAKAEARDFEARWSDVSERLAAKALECDGRNDVNSGLQRQLEIQVMRFEQASAKADGLEAEVTKGRERLYSYGLYSYGLYSYGLYGYDLEVTKGWERLYGYGLYGYDLQVTKGWERSYEAERQKNRLLADFASGSSPQNGETPMA